MRTDIDKTSTSSETPKCEPPVDAQTISVSSSSGARQNTTLHNLVEVLD